MSDVPRSSKTRGSRPPSSFTTCGATRKSQTELELQTQERDQLKRPVASWTSAQSAREHPRAPYCSGDLSLPVRVSQAVETAQAEVRQELEI